jgi:hypothetical protein
MHRSARTFYVMVFDIFAIRAFIIFSLEGSLVFWVVASNRR